MKNSIESLLTSQDQNIRDFAKGKQNFGKRLHLYMFDLKKFKQEKLRGTELILEKCILKSLPDFNIHYLKFDTCSGIKKFSSLILPKCRLAIKNDYSLQELEQIEANALALDWLKKLTICKDIDIKDTCFIRNCDNLNLISNIKAGIIEITDCKDLLKIEQVKTQEVYITNCKNLKEISDITAEKLIVTSCHKLKTLKNIQVKFLTLVYTGEATLKFENVKTNFLTSSLLSTKSGLQLTALSK